MPGALTGPVSRSRSKAGIPWGRLPFPFQDPEYVLRRADRLLSGSPQGGIFGIQIVWSGTPAPNTSEPSARPASQASNRQCRRR